MDKYRILLIEDEKNIAEVVKLNLEMEGYETVWIDHGGMALRTVSSQKFDLVILDVMLPGMDGFTICRAIRLRDDHTPILFLSAKGSSSDKVLGLKSGGDDYLAKPFDLQELLLRVKNLLKRSDKGMTTGIDTFSFSGNSVDFRNQSATAFDGRQITLTKKEAQLLKLLIENRNQSVSREQILNTVWGYDVYPTTRTIDNFIVNFRKYFEKNPSEPVHFIAVRGVGYMFKDG